MHCRTLVHVLMISRIDNYWSLHGDSLEVDLETAAGPEGGHQTGCRNHFSPDLAYMNWLPVTSQARLNVLVLSYEALYGLEPHYLLENLSPRSSPHNTIPCQVMSPGGHAKGGEKNVI